VNLVKEVSMDIIIYLRGKKEMSVDDIAIAMSTNASHIDDVITQKSTLNSENLESYLKNKNLKFWEFAIEAIPMDRLSPQVRKKVLLCKELSGYIKKDPCKRK